MIAASGAIRSTPLTLMADEKGSAAVLIALMMISPLESSRPAAAKKCSGGVEVTS